MTFNGNMEIKGQILICYAPGDGSLDFTWTGKEYPHIATGRKVLRWHVNRFLKTKEGKRLIAKGYKLYNINTHWTLVCTVVRKNKNTLLMSGDLYTYKVESLSPREANRGMPDCDLTVYYRYLSINRKFEVKNWSTRAVIRYFLNYEEELKRADKNGVVHYN